jgi:hypothetical protein
VAELTRPKITPRQRRFIELVAAGNTGIDAYETAYRCTRQSADANAARLRRRLFREIEEETRKRLSALAPKAVRTIDELMDTTSARVRLDAMRSIVLASLQFQASREAPRCPSPSTSAVRMASRAAVHSSQRRPATSPRK